MTWWSATWDAVLRVLRPTRTFTAPTLRASGNPSMPIDQMFGQMFGADSTAVRTGRDEALQVAALLRARNEICAIATLPLRQYRGSTGEVVPSTFLAQVDPDVTNVVTYAQTLEDLLFEGIAWWRITATDQRGYPLAARHVAASSVSLQPPDGAGSPAPLPAGGPDPRGATVWVDGQPVPAAVMKRFDSPNPGLLKSGSRSVRRALLLDRLAATYADSPRPLDYFTDSDDPAVDPLEPDEVPGFLARWRAGRKRSGTAWIPSNVKHVDISAPSPAELQLVELQKQATLDVANGSGLDAEDLGVSVTSRTYFNAIDRRQEKINRSYAPYMAAIAERLSMGDITPAGNTVRWDLADYLKSDPQGQAAYWEALQRMGVTDAAEIRTWAGLPGPPPAAATAPPAAPAATSDPADQMSAPVRTFTQPGIWQARFTGGQSFAVDTGRRTITGLAVPWGALSAPVFGMSVSFAPGSLEWSEVSRVKHLRDHYAAVGKAVELATTPDGLTATVDVQEGPAGDDLLAAAQHGTVDGFSVGVQFSEDPADGDVTVDDAARVMTVHRATLREISSTALPAFDDARHTVVRASMGGVMPCPVCGQPHPPGVACVRAAYPQQYRAPQPAPAPVMYAQPVPPPQPAPSPAPPPAPGGAAVTDQTAQVFAALPAGTTEDQLAQALAAVTASAAPAAAPPTATFVDPTRRPSPAQVSEPEPYVLHRGRRGDILRRGTHDFSTDLRAYWTDGDAAAGMRALSWVQRQFDTLTGDVSALNPPRQRPDLYVDQQEFTYPMWSAIDKGTLADITPFIFPKYLASSGLVGPHTEGQEPTPGDLTTTSQTVTPTGISGKAKITREVWDQGGNPQVSTLIWQQMTRGWYESLEASAVALLDAATPPQITLTAGGGTNGQTLVAELLAAMTALQFVRGGFRMRDAYAQIDLYQALTAATDAGGAPLLPILGPANRNGTTDSDLSAVRTGPVSWLPAWALAASGTVPASSYMFDNTYVHGWASAPQRLTMDTTEVAHVYLGIWGYQATAISDIAAVREVIYDPNAGAITQGS